MSVFFRADGTPIPFPVSHDTSISPNHERLVQSDLARTLQLIAGQLEQDRAIPDARLLGGRVNSSRRFRLRERALQARAQMRGCRERGLMGARVDLIAHQLFIADEVGLTAIEYGLLAALVSVALLVRISATTPASAKLLPALREVTI